MSRLPRLTISMLPTVALCFACSGEAEAMKAYEFTAFEAAGVQPDSPQPIVRNAREALPMVLRDCGVVGHEALDASDSAVVLRFELSASDERTLQCIRSSMPGGATLDEARMS